MIKPFQEIERITETIRKFQNQLSETTSIIQNSIKVTPVTQKKMEQSLLSFQKLIENLNKIFSSIPEFKNPILEHLETFKAIGERLKEYTEKTPEHFLIIANHGWFIDLESELELPARVASKLENDEINAANEYLVNYYRVNIDQIFDRLIIRHPDRKEILTQILSGYKSENYSLLIPSVLAQVDGICFDFTKRKFFITVIRLNPRVI